MAGCGPSAPPLRHTRPFAAGNSIYVLGHDIHALSRSGDRTAASAHDGNIITFHTVANFRTLVY